MDISELLNVFKQNFAPAKDIAEASHLFSTKEIFEAVQELDPGTKIKIENLFTALTEEGYAYFPEPDKFSLSFKWMLKRL